MGEATGSSALGFEPRALTTEPDDTELRLFRHRVELASGIPGTGASRRLVVDTVIRIVLAAGLTLAVALIVVMLVPASPATTAGALVGGGFLALVGAGGAVFLLHPIARRRRERRPWRRWYRLSRFADDNGLVYSAESLLVPGGTMFQQGKHRRVVDSLRTPDGSFTIGTFTFVAPDYRSIGRDPAYAFLQLRLPRPVPHLVLVSVARRGVQGYSAVGMAFAESQRVRLEGDFDRHFAVYAPDGYGADARFVLTPDLMARLADHASGFDLEFVDDRLYVYSAVPWDVASVATWEWARWFAETVGVAALRRTARFSDGRAENPSGGEPRAAVAPQGRRLRVGIPLVAGLITAGLIAVQVIRVVVQNLA